LKLNFTLINPTDMTLSVLNWGTPFEGWMGKIFEVLDKDGNHVPYSGRLVRRALPAEPTSYLPFEPYGIQNIIVDLTEAFDFPKVGDYIIRFRAPHYVDGHSIAHGQANRGIIGHLSTLPRKQAVFSPENTNCNSQQLSQINTAIQGSLAETKASYSCMSQRTCDALSVTWFGTYSASRFDYDKNTFNKIYNKLSTSTFKAYCNPPGCPSNVYAYVYPTDTTFTVYLCGLFWSLPAERVNTIVHEMSHFNSLGGTDDYAYGPAACKSLAKSNPTEASHNADNVCYFSQDAAKLFQQQQ